MKRRANLFRFGWLAAVCLEAVVAAGPGEVGPLVGTVTPDEAHFLYRPGAVEKNLRLSVVDAGGKVVAAGEARSDDAHDHVAKFHVTGLSPSTAYGYRIDEVTGGGAVPLLGPDDGLRFRTPMEAGGRGEVTAAFFSCANETSEPVFERLGMLGIDQLFLMGDTPYIDTADLAVVREKHRSFLGLPNLAPLIRGTPTVGTWDDHDFGLNNGSGFSFAGGKRKTRRGFIEYRAHGQFGAGDEGIYHKIDLGVMEVFLLDPRWFSQTAPSPVDPAQKTCFGAAQWEWLLGGLSASRAPFKVLAMGQIWQDKKNSETDDMFTYWYERDALLDHIRDKSIPGVVLVGGDIHVSRHLVHPRRTGYDLYDFVTSPAHTGVLARLDVPHPDLEWSLAEGRQFLTLTADTRAEEPVLTARFMRADGRIAREVVVPYGELTSGEDKARDGINHRLRARWRFEGDFENRSPLGSRLHAAPANGASLAAGTGVGGGGAARFSRAESQYLHVGRGALDDNSSGHTVSLWCRPATLPAHGGGERHFLLESTLGRTVGKGAGYALSIGFRSGDAAERINLELFTHTLRPAGAASEAPTAHAQGPFRCQLDRGLFTGRWEHVAVTFDGVRMRLFVGGDQMAEHKLPVPGPASENGGLVIGGHREGEGRNFDGLMDEIALWSRVLGPEEIAALHAGEGR